MDGKCLTWTNHIGTDLANYQSSIYQAWLKIGLQRLSRYWQSHDRPRTSSWSVSILLRTHRTVLQLVVAGKLLQRDFLMTRTQCHWLEWAQRLIVEGRSKANIAKLLLNCLYTVLTCRFARKYLKRSQVGDALQQLPYLQEARTKLGQICHI